MSGVRQWSVVAGLIAAWNEPDHYEWITAFFRERGMLRRAQQMMSAIAGSAAFIPIMGLVCERRLGPFLLAQAAGLVLAATMAVWWMYRWPSRRQSRTAVLLGLGCIAVWSQAQHDVEQSVPICMAAAITGGYIAVYHSTRLMIVNFVVALGLNIVTVYRLAHATEMMSAARAFWLIWLFNLAGPLSAWGAVRSIRAFVTRSNQDSLTGLLNRRAFVTAVLAQLNVGGSHSHLTVGMVDLDDFKSINDTYGHSTGDNTLIALAELLRRHTGEGAPICRAGGEEFLLARVGHPTDSASWAAQLCRHIVDLDPTVTASIGTASIALAHAPTPATAEFIEKLISRADAAMYTAKRNGGNHARHTVLT